MSDLQMLRDYCEYLDEVQGSVAVSDVVEPVRPMPEPPRPSAPLRQRRWGWAVAVAVALLTLVSFLPLAFRDGGEDDIADTTVATTSVPPDTTVATQTTIPARQSTPSASERPVIGDDHIVLAMAQSFPYNADDPEYLRTLGPDAAAGRTAGIVGAELLVDPESGDDVGLLQVFFMAFENEDLASAFLAAQLTAPDEATVMEEVFAFEGLGDEAVGIFVTNRGRGGGSSARATVRRGRFVAQVWVNPLDEERQSIEQARAFAGVADEIVQLVLSSDVQPREAPPEDLTSYRITVDANGAQLTKIVSPRGYGCTFSVGDDGWGGIAELSGEAWERVEGSWDWSRSESDSPRFQEARDHCDSWSPDLSQSYLASLIETAEGHAGVEQGRPTTSYWFTTEDLVAAGVLSPTDDITIEHFEVVVDNAGPWLSELSMAVSANDDATLAKVVLLDPQNFEKIEENLVFFHLEVDSFNDAAALADDLDEMVRPRPGG